MNVSENTTENGKPKKSSNKKSNGANETEKIIKQVNGKTSCAEIQARMAEHFGDIKRYDTWKSWISRVRELEEFGSKLGIQMPKRVGITWKEQYYVLCGVLLKKMSEM